MRRIVIAASLLAAPFCCVVHAQTGPPAAQDTSFEPALLDIVLAPLRSGTVSALRTDNRALLPVGAVLDILEVPYTVSDDGIAMFTRPSDGAQIQVDRRNRIVQTGRARRVLSDRFMVTRAEQTPLLDASIFATLLGVSMSVDWSELRVNITNGDSLPPAQRERRAGRWARLLATPPTEQPPPDQYRALDRPLADGAMVDYVLSVPTQSPTRNATYSTAIGANLLGGSLEGFATGTFNTTPENVTGSWLGVWRSNPWVTQLRVGDGLTSGPLARPVRGFTVGNTPFLRPLEYGTLPVSVRGDSAWEVESYVNGQLVRVDTLRGRNASIPMLTRYGSNVIDRIAYGPMGEVQRSEQLLSLTADDILPAGKVEYGVSAGECQSGVCTGTGNADLRVGVASRVSLRGGVEAEADSTHHWASEPYLGGAWLATDATTLSGSVLARGEATGTVRWQPTLDRGAVIEQTHRLNDVPFTDVIRGTIQDATNATAFTQLPWWNRSTQLSLTWRDDRAPSGITQDARLGVGVRTSFGQLYPYADVERLRDTLAPDLLTHAVGFSLYALPTRRFGPALAGTWLYATAEWRDNDQRFITTTVTRSIGPYLRLDVSLTAGARSAPSFGFRVFGDLGVARLISSTTVTGDAPTTGSHQLQGSVYVDPRRGTASPTRGPLLERGGVSGQVYLDMNANGKLDSDELPLAGVVVRVGGVAVVTDAHGRFLTTDVLPFEPVLVQLETASLESPLWVGAFDRMMVEPAPNSVRRIDIPVLPGGVVEGDVKLSGADSLATLAGVDVRLEAVGGGRSMTTTTFSDGAFAFLGVAPGRYQLHLDSSTWTGAAGDVIEVKPVANGDRVRGLVLRATRRPP